jgi:hypothetical protein
VTSTQRALCLAFILAAAPVAGAAIGQPAPAAAPADQPAPAAAPAAPAAAAPEAKPAPAAAPAAAASSGRIAAPPAGKGQVVFFRPSKFVGMALSFSIHEGDTGVGKLGNGSYFVVAADPGPHAYSIQGEATDTLNLEVEAGETQYVQQTIGVGVVMARPHLTPSDQATFDHLGSLKVSEKKPTDLKPSSAK